MEEGLSVNYRRGLSGRKIADAHFEGNRSWKRDLPCYRQLTYYFWLACHSEAIDRPVTSGNAFPSGGIPLCPRIFLLHPDGCNAGVQIFLEYFQWYPCPTGRQRQALRFGERLYPLF